MAFIRYFVAVLRIILSNPNCSSTDKLVFGLINSLSNNREYCYANNNYFANKLNIGSKTISNSLSKLNRLGYIHIKYINGKRHIYLNMDIVNQENSKVKEKNLPDTMEKKLPT